MAGQPTPAGPRTLPPPPENKGLIRAWLVLTHWLTSHYKIAKVQVEDGPLVVSFEPQSLGCQSVGMDHWGGIPTPWGLEVGFTLEVGCREKRPEQ